MKPLFEIGQEVIYWGKNISRRGEIGCITDRIFSHKIRTPSGNKRSGYVYKVPEFYNISGNNTDYGLEEALRPKPKGNGKSYTEFMNELKKDKVITI